MRIASGRAPGTTTLVARNPKDYEDNGILKPTLNQEFGAAGLDYAPSWRSAAGRLGLYSTDF